MSKEYRIAPDLRRTDHDAAVETLRGRLSAEELRIKKIRREKPNISIVPDDGPVLFAGPWIGEFGWELARWQGGIRRMARETNAYTIVMGDPGHDVLYEFASEYWEVPRFFREAGFTRQCDHVRGGEQTLLYLSLLARLVGVELSIFPDAYAPIIPQRFKPEEQEVVRLKTIATDWSARLSMLPYCCLIPRLRSWNRGKNWPVKNWERLVFELAGLPGPWPVVLTGRKEMGAFDSWCNTPPDLALKRSIDLLTHAQFAIASESGGALLSLLCGCPTLVLGHPSRERRITKDENFLDTPVRYLAREDYRFTVEEVVNAARAFNQTFSPA